jgi:hypothetical protein
MAGERLVGVHADKTSGAVWIVSDQHAWVSADAGTSWTKTTLIPAGLMQSITFADSLLGWAVTKNGIVEKQIGNPLLTSVKTTPLPGSLLLGAAYPNPVFSTSDGVMIPFATMHHGHVALTVHNASGKQIAILLDQSMRSGEHFTTWDPQSLSNGVYFLTLRAGGQAVTRRVVLAR